MLIDRKNAVNFCEDLRRQNKKIVFTNGCFDIIHAGHVRYLTTAKNFGDVLIVGLNTDESVKRLKGANRPINNQDDRAEVLLPRDFFWRTNCRKFNRRSQARCLC